MRGGVKVRRSGLVASFRKRPSKDKRFVRHVPIECRLGDGFGARVGVVRLKLKIE